MNLFTSAQKAKLLMISAGAWIGAAVWLIVVFVIEVDVRIGAVIAVVLASVAFYSVKNWIQLEAAQLRTEHQAGVTRLPDAKLWEGRS